MKYVIRIAALVAIFTCSFTAHSAGSGIVNLTTLSVGISGDVFVETDGNHTNPAGCSNATRYVIQSEIGGAKSMLAILLTARASALPVSLAIHNTNCESIGANTYAVIFNVSLR